MNSILSTLVMMRNGQHFGIATLKLFCQILQLEADKVFFKKKRLMRCDCSRVDKYVSLNIPYFIYFGLPKYSARRPEK